MNHIFICGAISKEGKFRLPHIQNICDLSAMLENNYYIYIVDPRHFDTEYDKAYMCWYQTITINHSFINRRFNPSTFHTEYLVNDDDMLLFIDCDNEFMHEEHFNALMYSKNGNWKYVKYTDNNPIDLVSLFTTAM